MPALLHRLDPPDDASANVQVVLATLVPADWEELLDRLTLYAYRLTGHRAERAREPTDYARDAVTKFLAGERILHTALRGLPPEEVKQSFALFLFGVVRSMVSNERTREHREPVDAAAGAGPATDPPAAETHDLEVLRMQFAGRQPEYDILTLVLYEGIVQPAELLQALAPAHPGLTVKDVYRAKERIRQVVRRTLQRLFDLDL